MRAAKTYDSTGSSATAWGEGRGKRAAEITAHALDMGPHGAFAVIPCTYGVLGRLRSWPRKRGAKSNWRRPVCFLHAMGSAEVHVSPEVHLAKAASASPRLVYAASVRSCAFPSHPPNGSKPHAAILLFTSPLTSQALPLPAGHSCQLFSCQVQDHISRFAPGLGTPCLLADVIRDVD
jgi:hypothetical protein